MAYPRPAFTVDAVVLAGRGEQMRLLVIERGRAPFAGRFAFPGGFVDQGENPLLACLRELVEETGLRLSPTFAHPLNLRAREGRDPRGWTISQPFLFHLEAPLPVAAADDARAAVWLPLRELKHLAFDHGAVLCEALGRFWPIFPMALPALKGIEAYGRPEHFPKRLTFYGGSFNPLHEGHLACVAATPRADSLVVVPDTNPFKQGPENRCYWQVYRRLRQALDPLALAVFPGFCGMETPNPTASWLPHLTGTSAGLLMGEDSLVSLPDWYDVDKLMGCMDHLVVVPRMAGSEQVKQRLAWVAARYPSCSLVQGEDHAWRHLSSTDLRNSAQGGETL